MIRQLDDKVMVSGQIAPHEVAGLAAQGVTVIINNRPEARSRDSHLRPTSRPRPPKPISPITSSLSSAVSAPPMSRKCKRA